MNGDFAKEAAIDTVISLKICVGFNRSSGVQFNDLHIIATTFCDICESAAAYAPKTVTTTVTVIQSFLA